MSVGVIFRASVRDAVVEKFGSQASFAAEVGVSGNTMSSWLRPGAEVSGQAIAAVMHWLPLTFEDACTVVEFTEDGAVEVSVEVDVEGDRGVGSLDSLADDVRDHAARVLADRGLSLMAKAAHLFRVSHTDGDVSVMWLADRMFTDFDTAFLACRELVDRGWWDASPEMRDAFSPRGACMSGSVVRL